MSLVACRACGHQVDTSALACPKCGATDPGHKISRQQRDLLRSAVVTIVWVGVLAFAGMYVWNTLIPAAKQYLVKPQNEAAQSSRQ